MSGGRKENECTAYVGTFDYCYERCLAYGNTCGCRRYLRTKAGKAKAFGGPEKKVQRLMARVTQTFAVILLAIVPVRIALADSVWIGVINEQSVIDENLEQNLTGFLIGAWNKYDAAMYACGVNPNTIDDGDGGLIIRAKLSNESTGGKFYTLAQSFSQITGPGGSGPFWLGSDYWEQMWYITQGTPPLYYAAPTNTLLTSATEDLQVILNGGDLGGGAPEDDGTWIYFSVEATGAVGDGSVAQPTYSDVNKIAVKKSVYERMVSNASSWTNKYVYVFYGRSSGRNFCTVHFEENSADLSVSGEGALGRKYCYIWGAGHKQYLDMNYPNCTDGIMYLSSDRITTANNNGGVDGTFPVWFTNNGIVNEQPEDNWPEPPTLPPVTGPTVPTPDPPSTPTQPTQPTPTNPTPVTPVVPPVTGPIGSDPVQPTNPTEPTPTPPTTPTPVTDPQTQDVVPWLDAILQEIQNLESGLWSYFDTLFVEISNHCSHLQVQMATQAAWMVSALRYSLDELAYQINDHNTDLTEWLGTKVENVADDLAYQVTSGFASQLSWLAQQVNYDNMQLLSSHEDYLGELFGYMNETLYWNINGEGNTNSVVYWLRMVWAKLGGFTNASFSVNLDDSGILAKLDAVIAAIPSGVDVDLSTIEGILQDWPAYPTVDISTVEGLLGDVLDVLEDWPSYPTPVSVDLSGLIAVLEAIQADVDYLAGIDYTVDLTGIDEVLDVMASDLDYLAGLDFEGMITYVAGFDSQLRSINVTLGQIRELLRVKEPHDLPTGPNIDLSQDINLQALQDAVSRMLRKFPFSTINNIVTIITALVRPARAPVFDLPVPNPMDAANPWTVHVDMSDYDLIASIMRTGICLWAIARVSRRTVTMWTREE